MPIIHFVKENKKISVNAGTNLREVARKNNIELYQGIHRYLNCHGFGMCGTCAVQIKPENAVSGKRRGEEKILAKEKKNTPGTRLACQCQVHSDVDVVTG